MEAGNAELERLRRENESLMRKLAELEEEVRKLRRELNLRNYGEQLDADYASGSELGMHILHKIGGVDSIPLAEVDFEDYRGWIAFGYLMKAGLIEAAGESVYITPNGRKALAEIGVAL